MRNLLFAAAMLLFGWSVGYAQDLTSAFIMRDASGINTIFKIEGRLFKKFSVSLDEDEINKIRAACR